METSKITENEMSNLVFSGLKALVAVHKIQEILAEHGIRKTRRVESNNDNFPKYSFRGIEDFYNVISPLLAEHGLLCIPNVIRKKYEVLESGKEPNIKRQHHIWIDVEYTLIAVEDGSFIKGVMSGEAIDSGDKASSKALSYAHKYFYQQLFSIPTTAQCTDDNTTVRNSSNRPVKVNSTNEHINSKAHWKASIDQIEAFKTLLKSLGFGVDTFLRNRNLKDFKGVTVGFIDGETKKIEEYMKNQNIVSN